MTGFSGFISAMRGDPADRPGPLQRAMLAPDRPDEPYDDDERQANLLGRGYAAGQATDLARRYGDTLAELAGVREANEAARKRQQRISRDHAAGRISAFDIAAMDFAEPDAAREQQLERRAESLRRQMADAQALIGRGDQRDADPLEAASRRAHEAFVLVTRARMAEAEARRPVPPPFASASRSRGGAAVRSENCVYCIEQGATDEEFYELHSDPDNPVPITTPEQAEQLQQAERRQADLELFGRQVGIPYRPPAGMAVR